MTIRTSDRPRSARRAGRCCRPGPPSPASSRMREDLVGRHAHGALAAQARDERAAPARLARAARLAEPDGVADELELDLAVGQESELLADLDRNGHLALGGNAHRSPGNT